MFHTQGTCPMTTGIFLRIVADAAEEDILNGKTKIAPYWRVIKEDGSINPKFPEEGKLQAKYLQSEKHKIVPGKRKNSLVVENFQQKLMP